MRDTPTEPRGDERQVKNVQYPDIQGGGARTTDVYGSGWQGSGIQELGFHGLGFQVGLIPSDQPPLEYGPVLPSQLETHSYSTAGGAPQAMMDWSGFPSQQHIAAWPFGADLSLSFLQAPLAAATENLSWTYLLCAPPTMPVPVPVVPAGGARVTASLSPPPPSPAPKSHPCGDCGDRVTFSSNKDLVRHRRSKHWPYSYRCWCGSTTQRKDNHRRHMKKCAAVATVGSLMQCGSCGQETSQVAVHRAHVQTCGDGKKGRPAKNKAGG